MNIAEVSLKGCPCIGRGRNSEIYLLEDGRALKLYPAGVAPEVAEAERQKTADAARLGVPTLRVYGLVQAEGRTGLVFDRVTAPSLREVIAKDPSRIEALAQKSAELLKHLHGLSVPTGMFPVMADTYRQRAENLADLLNRDEISFLCRMIEAIPRRQTYLHGDFHRGNLMVRGEDLLLIDMADSSVGNPFYDVLGVYTLGKRMTKVLPEATVKQLIGWDSATVARVWAVFRDAYFADRDQAALEEIEEMLDFFAWLRWLIFLKIVPGLTAEFRRNAVQEAREQFFPQGAKQLARFAGLIGCL